MPATGNPFGHGSSVPLLSHQWNCHSCPIQHFTNPHLYFTTSALLCPSRYSPFFNFPKLHPICSSQRSAILLKINHLLIPYSMKTSCILGLATTSMMSWAFKNPCLAFSAKCVLSSSAMSSSLTMVSHFWLNSWRGRSLCFKKSKVHSRMHHTWFFPLLCVLATISDDLLQEYFKFTSV